MFAILLLLEVLSYLCYNAVIINKEVGMGKKIDMLGKVFGRLTVVSEAPKNRNKLMVNCRCSCGNSLTCRSESLRSGMTGSCGCLQVDAVLALNTTHGMSKTVEHSAWLEIKRRIFDTTRPGYNNYGGRGISMCADWVDSFETFYKDMGPRPEGYSIDRIDNDGNYEPSNCRWATRTQQNQNSRACKLTADIIRDIRASSLTQRELSEAYEVSPSTISSILSRVTWKNII